MASPEFRVEPLDAARHRRAELNCESQALTDFLRRHARKEMAAKSSVYFVLVRRA